MSYVKSCANCTIPMESVVNFNGRVRKSFPGNRRDDICILCEENIGDKKFEDRRAEQTYCINVLHDSDFFIVTSAEDNRRGPKKSIFGVCKTCGNKFYGTKRRKYCSTRCRMGAHTMELLDKIKQLEDEIEKLKGFKVRVKCSWCGKESKEEYCSSSCKKKQIAYCKLDPETKALVKLLLDSKP